MIIQSKVITQPQSEPVTVAEARQHLRIDGTDEDTYIDILIKVARQLCEQYSGLSFITQQREIKLDRFPCAKTIEIPYGPVQTIDDFVYIDNNGYSQPLTEDTDFIVDIHSSPARVQYVNSWPSTLDRFSSVTIAYTSGYANDDHDPVPEVIKQAMLLQIGSMYENRQNDVLGMGVNSLNMNSEYLLDMVKVYWNANA